MKKFSKNKTVITAFVVIAILLAGLIIAAVIGGSVSPGVTNPSTATQPETNGTTQPTQMVTTTPATPTEPTEPTEPPHDHFYTEEVIGPTCTEKGYTIYTCSCGNVYCTDETSALGHELMQYVSNANATCEADGTKTSKCSRCNVTETVTDPGSTKGHSWSDWAVSKEATETVSGEERRECATCGKTETRETGTLEHTHAYKEAVTAPTCEADGYTTYTCTCGDSYKGNEVAALGHNYTDVITEPTCTTGGYTTRTCARCSKKIVENKIDALGHSWGDWVVSKEPTETTVGEELRGCMSCGKTETRETGTLEHTHVYTESIFTPTCELAGYTTYTCACGDSYKCNEVAALGHNFNNYLSDNNASCTEDGTKTSRCERCDISDTIPDNGSATGHAWGDWMTVLAPTSESEGKQERACSACGATEEQTLDKLPEAHKHAYTSKIVEATCTEQGYTLYACACGNSYQDDFTKALGHAYVKKVTEATCTEGGYTTYICSACDDSYVGDNVNAKGHSYSDWSMTTESSCEKAGQEQKVCVDCGDTQVRDVAATGHNYTAAVTEPTCEVGGYTTHTCKTCGDSYQDSKVGALGHNYGAWTTVEEPTCTQAGQKQRTCSRCGEKETETLAKANHAYNSVATAATCENSGYTTYTCKVCGANYQGNETAALGHSYGSWTVTRKPTCVDVGEEQRTCSRCGETEVRAVDALGGMRDVTYATVTHTGNLNVRSGPGTGYSKLGTLSPGACVQVFETTTVGSAQWARVAYGSHENAWICTTGYASLETVSEPVGHAYGDWLVVAAATCVAGQEERICETCGVKETREIAATGHNYEIAEKAATCTSVGSLTKTCKTCGNVVTEEIEALGHGWSNWATEGDVVCGEEAEEKRTCSRCGEQETRTSTSSGHDWGIWLTTTVATTTADGERARTCKACGATETEVIPMIEEEHKHSYETTKVAASCTTAGYTYKVCTDCGKFFKGNTVSATGHVWSDWETTQKPTTSSVGYEQRTCSTCGEIQKVAIPMLNADGSPYESYIDKMVSAHFVAEHWVYDYNNISISDFRTWGAPPSIWVNEDGGVTVVYYNTKGERIEVCVDAPPEGYTRGCIISDEGTYRLFLVGDFG